MQRAPEDRPGTPPARPRSPEVIIPHRPRWHGEIAAAMLWVLGSSLSKTWRVRVRDESRCLGPAAAQPVIIAVWHNRLAVSMRAWEWLRKQGAGRKLTALISASRDGGLLTRTFEYFGITPVRGSSSRRGPQALLELMTAAGQGSYVAITPDGPRGPKYAINDGILILAEKTGVPIVPFGAWLPRKIRLRSWDAFQIPLPFSKCEFVFGTPIQVPPGISPEQRQEIRLQLESALNRLNPD